jgi:dTDP-L-rhamnose 4-epimerase
MYEMSRYMDTNVRGTAVLLDACVRARVPQVVLSSSRAVYGEGSWRCDACGPVHPGLRLPSKEGTAITWNPLCPRCRRPAASLLPTHEGESADPVSVYGISKLAQEQLVDMAGRAFGLDCSILRFFNVFGPGQSLSNPYTGVLAVFVNRARLGRPLDLYEDGRIVRDFVHVDDVVRALMLAAEKRPRCPVNIGSGRTVTIGEIAGMVVRLTRSSSPLQITGKSRVGDVRGLVADLSRAGTALGWAPEVAFEDGLRSFVEWASRSAPTDSYEGSLAELKDKGLYQ